MRKFLVLAVVCCGMLSAAGNLKILPGSIELTGPEARHQLLVEADLSDHQEDLTRKAQWKSSNLNVATVDAGGLVSPVSDGEATITGSAEGSTVTATVRVKNAKAP